MNTLFRAIGRYLMISRPGMWGVTSAVYLFAIPTFADLQGWALWLGFALVVVPMNFIACAWNDLRDADVDAKCKRKTVEGNLLVNAFGMAHSTRELAGVFKTITWSTAAVGAALAWAGANTLSIFTLLSSFLFANATYNEQPLQLSRKGPFELLIVVYVYLHALFLPAMLSELPAPSLLLVLCASLYIAALQLAGEITDMKTDGQHGKITTAVLLGQRGALWACRVLLLALLVLSAWDQMYGLSAVAAAGLVWLALPTRRARSQASVLYVLFALYPIVWLALALFERLF